MSTCVITVVALSGGTATPLTGPQTIGVPILLSAIPTPGYDFVQWTDGVTIYTTPILSITPTVNKTYTCTFKLHDWTQSDYTNISNFLNSYYIYAGLSGNTPNAALATKMLPQVIAIENEIRMFDFAKSFSLDTSGHYANILSILNEYSPVIIPIV